VLFAHSLEAVRVRAAFFFDAAGNDLPADPDRAAIDESGIDDRWIKVGYGEINK
jgi:hypothetical protein